MGKIALILMISFSVPAIAKPSDSKLDFNPKEYLDRVTACGKGENADKVTGTGSNAERTDNSLLRKSCVYNVISDLRAFRTSDKCNNSCREVATTLLSDISSFSGITNVTDENRAKKCDSAYAENKDDVKECKKLDKKTANACAKAESGEGMMDSDTAQMTMPFMTMVPNADLLMGVYSAMNDKPGCYLTKDDFIQRERDMKDQAKDIKERISKATQDAEEAKKEFSEKLSDFEKEENEIIEELNAMPREKEKNLRKLDDAKVNAKMKAQDEYSALQQKIAAIRQEYNTRVDQKAVTLAENSKFSAHDECAAAAVGQPAANKRDQTTTMTGVQANFAGAFAQGKSMQVNIQNRYKNCMNVKMLKVRQLESAFVSNLNALKAQLISMDGELARVVERKRLAEEAINQEIQDVVKDADERAKSLQRKYQLIQTKKLREQAMLKDKLMRIETDAKKAQQELAVLNMKLQAYNGKRPPRNADKSIGELMDQCGANFIGFVARFKDECCEDEGYTGEGAALCKTRIDDFMAEPEKLTPEEAKKEREKHKSNVKRARKTR